MSSAYYGLFHLLVSDAARALAPRTPEGLRAQAARALSHGDMKQVCREFRTGSLGQLAPSTRALVVPPLGVELISIADTFVTLQEERHAADYAHSRRYGRIEVIRLIGAAEKAFEDWATVRSSPNASVFLAALALQRSWGR